MEPRRRRVDRMVSGSSEVAASEGQLVEANGKLPSHLAKKTAITKRRSRRMQIWKAVTNQSRLLKQS